MVFEKSLLPGSYDYIGKKVRAQSYRPLGDPQVDLETELGLFYLQTRSHGGEQYQDLPSGLEFTPGVLVHGSSDPLILVF